MFALKEFLLALLVIHLAWLWFFLCGSLLRVRAAERAPTEDSAHGGAVLEIVLCTASGIALTGLATFVLGLAHMLYPFAFVALIAGAGVAFARLGDSPLQASFWRRRLALWRAAVSPGTLILYAVALTLAAPAILPDLGSDATSYYYPYALEWARAHAIVTDEWLRFPYYADNWVLLYAWAYVFSLERFAAFLSWLTGTLSIFAIYGTVLWCTASAAAGPRAVRFARLACAVIAPAALVLSPTFLHWADIGMIDTALGFFYFATAIGTMLLLARSERASLPELIVCAAFLVGMKPSLVLMIPLFALSIFGACAVRKSSMKRALAALGVFLVLASPWYVRNFVLAGDPLAPLLNLTLNGVDKLDTVADLQLLSGDLHGDDSAAGHLRLPLDIIKNTPSLEYREPGVTWLLLLLGVPGLVLAYGLVARRTSAAPSEAALYVACAFLVYAIGYWNLTSHLARYALLFYALLAAVLAVLAVWVAARAARFAWAAPVAVALLCVPSPGSAAWLGAHWMETNGTEFFVYRDPAKRFAQSPEVSAIRATGRELRAAGKPNAAVFRLHLEPYTLFFREQGLVPVGDWVGPGRYRDFIEAVETQRLEPYMRRLGLDALLIQTPNKSFQMYGTARYWTAEQQAMLDQEATALRMRRIPLPGEYVLYIAKPRAYSEACVPSVALISLLSSGPESERVVSTEHTS